MNTNNIVQKLWNYCNVLRDDGMSYGDYVEQLTYLLFLKMADERTQAPYLQTSIVPAQWDWQTLLFFDKKAASETPWTKKLWIYDLRTNKHFTLKTKALQRNDLDEFIECYNPANRFERKPTWSEADADGRWRAYDYDELVARDKASLDIFWLKDASLEDSENLPAPGVIAAEIVEDLEVALEQMKLIAEDLAVEGNDE